MSTSNASVEIQVFDYRRNRLPSAKVRLQRADSSGGKGRRLKYDEGRAAFLADDVEPGAYQIKVTSRGLASESRAVDISGQSFSTMFLLGNKGMPFYYRGIVRVPFERRDDLVGICTHRLDARREQAFQGLTSRLKLEEAEVEPVKYDENLHVCSLPKAASAKARSDAISSLKTSRDVQHAGPVVELSDEGLSFLTEELVAKFKPDVAEAEVRRLAKQLGLKVLRQLPYSKNGFLLSVTDSVNGFEVLDACSRLIDSGRVEYAEPNLITSMVDDQVVPTDFLYSSQWHLPKINMEEAWQVLRDRNAPATSVGDAGDQTFGTPEVIIAVMDRGIQSQTSSGTTTARSRDFSGTVSDGSRKVYRFFDFAALVANNDNPPNDHGMGCAGVATALAENPSIVAGETEGVVGAAPNCRVMGLIRPSGGTETQYADAYYWAAGLDPNSTQPNFPAPINPGADIITNSFGASTGSPISATMRDCFDDLTENGRGGRGVALLFSAGNGNTTLTLQRPWAAYSKTMAIAASTNNDVRANYSNFGPEVDVCAPSSNGIGITTTDTIGGGNLAGHTGGSLDYRDSFGGTSSATPLVAGVAALMLSANPFLTWSDIRDILRRTAVKIDFSNTNPVGRWVDNDGDGAKEFSQWYGYGRIDAEAAIREASLLFAAQVRALSDVRRQ